MEPRHPVARPQLARATAFIAKAAESMADDMRRWPGPEFSDDASRAEIREYERQATVYRRRSRELTVETAQARRAAAPSEARPVPRQHRTGTRRRRNVRTRPARARAPDSADDEAAPAVAPAPWLYLVAASERMHVHEQRREARWRARAA